MTEELGGRVAVVTGGGSGIGAAIAERLVGMGAAVTLLGRGLERVEAKAKELGGGTRALACDVTNESEVQATFEALGTVGVLINNAGAAESRPLHATSTKLWDRMLAVNLTGPFLCSRAVISGMKEAGWGRIITVASTAGLAGAAYVSAYCAAKHGAVGMVRALAQEVANKGITVNAVCPGYTDTELVSNAVANIAKTTGRSEEEALESITGTTPQGRLVTPAEVAATVAWLCGPDSDSVNGQAIAIDGGAVR